MPDARPRIAITMGDANGIGPEVVLKSLLDPRLQKYFDPLIVADIEVLKSHAKAIGLQDVVLQAVEHPEGRVEAPALSVLHVGGEQSVPVSFGTITKEAGALSMKAVETAIDLCLEKRVDAMVTAPISKEAISKAGYDEKGHSGFIAKRTSTDSYTMMMVTNELRVGLVTEHIPIWEVPKRITVEAIEETVEIISQTLSRDFAIDRPRIAVLGLNPHAGDGGLLGREEGETIEPAIEACCKQGHMVLGPFPADGFFAVSHYRNFDAVLAMYHDQGLIPFKALSFGNGVNYTAGLPIVRTSPDHGTAFNIAGKGIASSDSMRSAIYLALDIVRRRKSDRLQIDG